MDLMNMLVTGQYLHSNGGGGGVSSWNDLTDKPFYHNQFSEVVIDNLTKEDYENNNKPSCTFIPGDLYTVIWNGTYYENIKCYTGGGWNTIQDPNVFCIDDQGGNGLCIFPADKNNNYTVSVIHNVSELQKLDEKYIPDTIARKDDLDHVTYWSDLEDKPFYDTGIKSITWDGDTTNKEKYMFHLRIPMYKISDEFIPPEVMTGAALTLISRTDGAQDVGEIVKIRYDFNTFKDEQTYTAVSSFNPTGGDHILVVHSEENDQNHIWPRGVYVSERIINKWYVSEIKFNSSIKPLDEKYLPNTIPNIEEVQQMIDEAGNTAGGGSQSDWNENDETSASYVQNRTHYSEIVQQLLFAETEAHVDYFGGTTGSGDKCYLDYVIFCDENNNYAPLFTIDLNKTYIVTYDSVEYRLTPFSDQYGIYVGRDYNRAATPEEAYPFTIGYYPDYPSMELAIYELGTHTVSVSSEEEIVYKLDAKYIPNAVQGDWNETNTSSLNYIKNKPFGLFLGEKIQTTCDIIVPAEDLSVYAPGVYSTPDYKYPGDFWLGDFTYEVIIDGVPYYTQAIDGYSDYDYLGSFNLTSNPAEAEFPFLIYRDGSGHILIYFTSPGPHTVKITSYVGGYELVKIDPMFLPDNIGGGGGGVTVEKVQQMINDALGVIENGTY